MSAEPICPTLSVDRDTSDCLVFQLTGMPFSMKMIASLVESVNHVAHRMNLLHICEHRTERGQAWFGVQRPCDLGGQRGSKGGSG